MRFGSNWGPDITRPNGNTILICLTLFNLMTFFGFPSGSFDSSSESQHSIRAFWSRHQHFVHDGLRWVMPWYKLKDFKCLCLIVVLCSLEYYMSCSNADQCEICVLQSISRNFDHKCSTSLRSSKVHNEIHKPVCKLRIWLASFNSGTNQGLCLQIGLWIPIWTCEHLWKFGTFVVKVSWNRL